MSAESHDREHDDLEHWADQFVGHATRVHNLARVAIPVIALALAVLLFVVWSR
jgi:hypothetical protein